MSDFDGKDMRANAGVEGDKRVIVQSMLSTGRISLVV